MSRWRCRGIGNHRTYGRSTRTNRGTSIKFAHAKRSFYVQKATACLSRHGTKETSKIHRDPGSRRSPVSSRSRGADAKDEDVRVAAIPPYPTSHSGNQSARAYSQARSHPPRGRTKNRMEAGLGRAERESPRRRSTFRRKNRNAAKVHRDGCFDVPLAERLLQLDADGSDNASCRRQLPSWPAPLPWTLWRRRFPRAHDANNNPAAYAGLERLRRDR